MALNFDSIMTKLFQGVSTGTLDLHKDVRYRRIPTKDPILPPWKSRESSDTYPYYSAESGRSNLSILYKETYAIFYDLERNIFKDEDGYTMFNLYEWVTPGDVLTFKHLKSYYVVPSLFDQHIGIEMFWPDEEYRIMLNENPAWE